MLAKVEVTEVYSPSRDEAGVHSIMAAPLALLPAGMERVVLLAPGTITVACLAPFLAYLAGCALEQSTGESRPPKLYAQTLHLHYIPRYFTQRDVLLAPGTVTVSCLAPLLSYLAGFALLVRNLKWEQLLHLERVFVDRAPSAANSSSGPHRGRCRETSQLVCCRNIFRWNRLVDVSTPQPYPCLSDARLEHEIGITQTRPLNSFPASRLEHELGMSIAPDDTRWRGRVFDAGLVVFRDTGASRDCSSAWARDLVARVAAQGAAADSAASLAAVEGPLSSLLSQCCKGLVSEEPQCLWNVRTLLPL